jgi:hypothetical protein
MVPRRPPKNFAQNLGLDGGSGGGSGGSGGFFKLPISPSEFLGFFSDGVGLPGEGEGGGKEGFKALSKKQPFRN